MAPRIFAVGRVEDHIEARIGSSSSQMLLLSTSLSTVDL